MEEQVAFAVPDELRSFAGEGTVGNANPRFGIEWHGLSHGLASRGPAGCSHQAAKIPPVEMWVLVGHDIGKTGALGCSRAMIEAVIERLEKLFGETGRVRIGRLDRFAFRL